MKILFFLLLNMVAFGQKEYVLKSPDQQIAIQIKVGKTNVTYSVRHDDTDVLLSSPVSMKTSAGEIPGEGAVVRKSEYSDFKGIIRSPFYKKKEITDIYNQLTLSFKGDWQLQFRAYNDGIAYRFITSRKGELTVENEQADFCLPGNYTVYAPFVRPRKSFGTPIEQQFMSSFENTYQKIPVADLPADRLMFLPVLVELEGGKKMVITEADLESYPGMYLHGLGNGNNLKAMFATYPKTEIQGGHNELQLLVKERENFIAKTQGTRTYPWRVLVIADEDAKLADNDLVYKLAAPSRMADVSWVKPGKVAWDWWNNWNLSGVDFPSGINNETYKKYIDFAASQGIEYVILDEGWAVNKKADLFAVVPEIDLAELIEYGRLKNVGIVLWVGYYPMEKDMERVCRHYAAMGVKGFKVDFMDRDDQKTVDFLYKLAETAARNHLFLDYHGTHKPTGLSRTYPNVLNYEGVHGLEQMKWAGPETDQVTYDVTLPFIRMVAGPLDYTQGAMRNSIKANYFPAYTDPMSQGTRCRQLAEYVVFESPFNMLCDNPIAYMREPECTAYIAEIPTVWDRTVVVNGKVGEYITIARQKGADWYIGGMTGWSGRNMELDLSFLGEGRYEIILFRDGINAGKVATDYKKETVEIPENKKIDIYLATGGGFAGKIVKK